MEARLLVEYDRIGDILYLGTVSPYPEQESEELDYGVVARLNPQSGEIENLEILSFLPESQVVKPYSCLSWQSFTCQKGYDVESIK